MESGLAFFHAELPPALIVAVIVGDDRDDAFDYSFSFLLLVAGILASVRAAPPSSTDASCPSREEAMCPRREVPMESRRCPVV